jgi:hypothetical protein
MDFSYSDYWLNKCSGYNDVEQLNKDAEDIFNNYGFDKSLLFHLVVNKYDFVSLGLDPKYLHKLLNKIKFKINTTPIPTDIDKIIFLSIWKDKVIHSSIQQLLRKNFVSITDGSPNDLATVINKGYSYFWTVRGNYRNRSRFHYSDIAFRTDIALKPNIINGINRLPKIPLITNSDTLQIIRAAKSSGKSFQMEQLCKRFKAQNVSILAITHLRSLAKHLSERLGLDNYLTDKHQSLKPNYTDTFICSINSLPKYFNDAVKNNNSFTVIIIDEFEQVINTLFSAEYISSLERVNIITLINHFISNAKYTYLLDADAGKLTKSYANNLKTYKPSLDVYFYSLDTTYKRDVYICTRKYKAYYEILKSLYNDENIIIVSNRRSETSNIFYKLKMFYFDMFGKNLSALRIDGSTSTRPESVKFFNDPTEESKKYQVLVYNQKLMTGVSIESFGHFKKVFGIFSHSIYKGSISSVNTNLQMVSRYRDLVPIYLYIEYIPKFMLNNIKPSVPYPGIKQNNLITDTFKSFSKDLYETYTSNVKDYYMEHISLMLESGYNISILDFPDQDRDYVKKSFVDKYKVRIFYKLTEYDRNRLEDFNDKEEILELRRLFIKLNFDIYNPVFGRNNFEILKSNIVSSKNVINRRIKDLGKLNPTLLSTMNITTNFRRPKYILESIFKHINLRVIDRDIKATANTSRDVGYTVRPK